MPGLFQHRELGARFCTETRGQSKQGPICCTLHPGVARDPPDFLGLRLLSTLPLSSLPQALRTPGFQASWGFNN